MRKTGARTARPQINAGEPPALPAVIPANADMDVGSRAMQEHIADAGIHVTAIQLCGSSPVPLMRSMCFGYCERMTAPYISQALQSPFSYTEANPSIKFYRFK